MLRAAFAAGLVLLTGMAAAADYRAGPDNYRDVVRHLQPGDRLLLAPGDYLRGLPLHGLSGRAGESIIIEAADPGAMPRFLARPGSNTVSLVNVRYLILRYLELDGRNVPVDAVKAEGHSRFADFITLEHLYIHDHAASQQNVGISTKCPAFGWLVKRNRIERVGTGMYFGDSDGSDPFVGGVIEANRVVRTLGYNLQIKHQKARSAEYGNRRDTVIRYNVFSKSDSLPGKQARPNVLLGHGPLSGAGVEDRYLLHGNLFLHNPSEALLQAEGRVAVYDNTFINGDGDAIHIQPHNDVPRGMAVFSNTVLASGAGIRIRQAGDAPWRQRVIANVVAAGVPIQGGEAMNNVMLPYRRDFLATPIPLLTMRLLERTHPARPLPAFLARELAVYPDWQGAQSPGASVPVGLMQTLNPP